MSDALRRSVDRLKSSSARLNQIANEAAVVVKTVEDFLSHDCGVGIQRYILVKEEASGPDEPPELTHLGYDRYQGKFRLVVTVGISDDEQEYKPWSEWDRTTKLEAVEKLPALLEAIAADVDKRVTSAQQATASVISVLSALPTNEQPKKRGYTPPDQEGISDDIPF